MTKFQPGYGPAGKVPAYVEAHVLSLEASPFAQRVISPGRRRVRPCSAAATPNRRCATTAEWDSRIVNDRPATAGSTARGHSKTNHSGTGRSTPPGGGGRCLANHARHRKKRGGSASSSLLFRPRQSVFDHGVSTVHDTCVRPATAPHSQRTTAPTTALTGGRGFVAAGRKTRRTREEDDEKEGGEEARLVEKLANLAGVQRGSEFPTVTALKTAVAIKEVQKQLRENRLNRARSQEAPVPELRSSKQTVAQTATGSIAIAAGSRIRGSSARVWRSGSREREQLHEVEPWDNHTPFFGCNDAPSHTANSVASASPTSKAASALKILTLHDPVFGHHASSTASEQRQELPGSRPLQTERRRTTSLSPSRGKRESFREHNPARAKAAAASVPGSSVVGTADLPMAPSAQEMKMQACFRRLTVGALIELNHLRNPPKPVLAVLGGLACLLGWKQSNNSPTKNRRDGKHRHHRRPPRSLFSDAYLLRDILASIFPRRIPSRRLSALAKRLRVPEAAPPKVKSANAAAGVLLEWLLAVVECARAS